MSDLFSGSDEREFDSYEPKVSRVDGPKRQTWQERLRYLDNERYGFDSVWNHISIEYPRVTRDQFTEEYALMCLEKSADVLGRVDRELDSGR